MITCYVNQFLSHITMLTPLCCLLLTASAAAVVAGSAPAAAVPSFDLRWDLANPKANFQTIEQAAKTAGAFALSGLSKEYQDAVKNLKGNMK